jgi:transposase-like protein
MFIPPFCPKKHCRLHNSQNLKEKWYFAFGFHDTKTFGRVQRFKCKSCLSTFSIQTFNIDYYAKKILSYQDLMESLSNSMSIRNMSRHYHVSTGTIANRLEKLSHQVISQNKQHLKDFKLKEDLVADGFESFTVSQYFPENISLLVGKKSQFVFSYHHVTIRRKGRMTEKQKKKRDFINEIVPFQPNGIFKSFKYLMKTLLEVWDYDTYKPLTLWTDEKPEYEHAILSIPELREQGKIGYFNHAKINSRIARTLRNPLFPVNYMDRELRKDIAAYRRETVCFARNINAAMARLSVYFYYHNYYKAYRIKNTFKYTETHASVAGLGMVNMRDESEERMFTDRYFLSHQSLNEFEMDIWMKRLVTPLKRGPEYVPAYYAG